MVGDGVNDAAALAGADAGIAVHGGAEASLSAADIYIAKPGLAPLVELFQAARRTQKVLRVAWAVSLAYNLSFITLAAVGILKPWMAAVLMPVSSITVVLIAVGGGHGRKETPLGGVALAAFLSALKRGQFDDLETPAWRAIFDDEPKKE
jgi:cbb3-type cytochrome oxidase maturation protein